MEPYSLSNTTLVTKEYFEELKRKAKAFDEVRSFIIQRLKEEKTTDEYDYGERFVCEEIEDIIQEKSDELERVDDER